MLRILISAYGCEPAKGSEQGVGWNWCIQLANIADIVVLTRSNNKSAIEAAFPESLKASAQFVFFDLPPAIRFFKNREKRLHFYYLIWQWGAYRRARQLVKQSRFDYAMHLTFGSIWLPTFMHRLPVPFIWGPVGGGEAVLLHLIHTLPVSAWAAQYLRYLLMLTLPINPLFMAIVRRSTLILARTRDTARLIPTRYHAKVRIELETGVTAELLNAPPPIASVHSTGPLRVIYTGRLVALKNVSAAIQALARARQRGYRLRFVIVGDGPLRSSLQRQAAQLGLSADVEFIGPVSQSEVIEELRRSDIYLFPSLKEGGVWSLIEAMAVGLPIICVKTSGMAEITDDRSAIQVMPVSQEYMITQFAQALVDLSESSKLRSELGENARTHIKERLLWSHKREFMRALFDELEASSR